MWSILRLAIISASLLLINGDFTIKSRAVQNFGCNCLFNSYMQDELELGLFYLNASIYMLHDSVAMKGFGNMFNTFWLNQLENTNTIRKYTLKRGGFVETREYKLKRQDIDHFANESILLHQVLQLEKKLNTKLHELHRCSSDLSIEEKCRKINKKIYSRNPIEKNIVDPHAANFLDENLINQKVERIKYLADLYKRVTRFNVHLIKNGHITELGLNPIGVHTIDQELEAKYQ